MLKLMLLKDSYFPHTFFFLNLFLYKHLWGPKSCRHTVKLHLTHDYWCLQRNSSCFQECNQICPKKSESIRFYGCSSERMLGYSLNNGSHNTTYISNHRTHSWLLSSNSGSISWAVEAEESKWWLQVTLSWDVEAKVVEIKSESGQTEKKYISEVKQHRRGREHCIAAGPCQLGGFWWINRQHISNPWRSWSWWSRAAVGQSCWSCSTDNDSRRMSQSCAPAVRAIGGQDELLNNAAFRLSCTGKKMQTLMASKLCYTYTHTPSLLSAWLTGNPENKRSHKLWCNLTKRMSEDQRKQRKKKRECV